ncbi:acyl carrier protein [Streptomyces sp. Ncost-T6T-1]|uniref:acyl carrier protein n=1 Tax=Streptomyces sp. Ncost-T6T-1 TaxID=1100828 RepID=UPI00080568B9|nr:acyl carrier protein [Streptomyces sp. Ncost-T6T-1]SBV04583.1 acyl carrier protein [Streptomyces sp. Ncost-T6T-1]
MSVLDKIVAEALGIGEDEITDETGAAVNAEWTSLRHVQIVAAVNREFGVRLTPRQARSCRSVGELRKVLTERGHLV